MKKLSLFLLVSVFAFCGCSDENDEVKGGDDNKGGENEKKEVVVSFENQLTQMRVPVRWRSYVCRYFGKPGRFP